MQGRRVSIWCAALLFVLLILPAHAFAKSEQWEYIGTEEGVRVSRMSVEGSSLVAFRGETIADVHIAKLMAVFGSTEERQHWVDRYESHETIERTKLQELYRIRFKMPFPVKDRDYVLFTEAKPDQEKRSFTVQISSVDDPRVPENSCCVRAIVHRTYYYFEALKGPEPRTRMVVEVHTDPKGIIPNWLVNRIQKGWPSTTLSNLINHTHRSKLAPVPELANWHDE